MIALDANIFIYMLEGHPTFGLFAKELFVAVEQGTVPAIASELVFLEALGYAHMSTGDADRARQSLERLGVKFVPITSQVLVEAARLRRESQLGALDSIHVASALAHTCEVFITNDHELLKKSVAGIRLLGLSEANVAVLTDAGA